MTDLIRLKGSDGPEFLRRRSIDGIVPVSFNFSTLPNLCEALLRSGSKRRIKQSPEQVARLLGWAPPEEGPSPSPHVDGYDVEERPAGYDEHLGPVDADGAPIRRPSLKEARLAQEGERLCYQALIAYCFDGTFVRGNAICLGWNSDIEWRLSGLETDPYVVALALLRGALATSAPFHERGLWIWDGAYFPTQLHDPVGTLERWSGQWRRPYAAELLRAATGRNPVQELAR